MDRRTFLQATVPTGIALSSSVRMEATPGPDWTIANNQLKIVLAAATKGGLSAFTDLRSQRNFIGKESPLYRLSVVQKGGKLLALTSVDATSLNVERKS